MEPELIKKIEEQQVKIDAIYKSVEKTRKYFLAIIWVTILGFGYTRLLVYAILVYRSLLL